MNERTVSIPRYRKRNTASAGVASRWHVTHYRHGKIAAAKEVFVVTPVAAIRTLIGAWRRVTARQMKVAPDGTVLFENQKGDRVEVRFVSQLPLSTGLVIHPEGGGLSGISRPQKAPAGGKKDPLTL